LRNPGAALSDALQAAIASRLGGLLVTLNPSDFGKLQAVLPFRFQGFEEFRDLLSTDPSE
jgi:predicted nucleic acid-binding protein